MQLDVAWDNQSYLPRPALAPYFQKYKSVLRRRNLSHPRPFTIFPDGSAHILFHLFFRTDQLQGNLRSRLAFVGPRSIFEEINRQNRLLTLIFSFRPGGAFSFFSFPMREVADLSVNLTSMWGEKAVVCQEQMTEKVLAGELNAAVRLMEEFLEQQLETNGSFRPVHPIVQRSLDVLQQQPQTTVSALANQYGVSTRYLHQLFTTQVGLGAKRFSCIQRVMATLRAARHGWDYGWADLALTHGYYDQAHMIDEFQLLLGSSPQKMISEWP